MTPGTWQAGSGCGTWLLWPCRPRRGPNQGGAMVRACRWHTDWRGQGNQSILSYPNMHASTRWLGRLEGCFERPTRGRMRLQGLHKTGSSGALVCRGGHPSRRYRRIWPRWGKLHWLALFAENPGHSLKEAGQLQGRTMLGSKPKLLISHQSLYAYYM